LRLASEIGGKKVIVVANGRSAFEREAGADEGKNK
jgi:hypothetical protein